MRSIRTPIALAAAAGLLGAALAAGAQTPPPPPDARAPIDGPMAGPRGPRPAPMVRDTGPETTLTGRVARWLVNPNGDVDGLLLDDGTQVDVPPHLSMRLIDAVQPKDAVEITGRRADGAAVVRATRVKGTRTGRSVDDAGPPGPDAAPPVPRPTAALAAMTASGRIQALLHTGRGDVNGALLQDGTIVRFPPREVAALADALKPGAPLYASGYGTRTPQGTALEAATLGASADSARDVFARPAPGGPGARPPEPRPPELPVAPPIAPPGGRPGTAP